MSAGPAVEVSGLTVVRGGRLALDGVSCTVAAGQVAGLLGPSGSGKSTLMRSVVGVQRVSAGTVTVLGAPAGSPAARAMVGYRTQGLSVYGDLTPRENLQYIAALVGAPASTVGELLATVQLGDDADRRVDQLSGGQQARVSLAAALVGEPAVLVLDEPTVGLDPVLRRDLWALFRGIAARGATLLVSSHVMDEATHCDRLLLLHDGRLVADEPPADLLARTGAPDLDAAFLHLVTEPPVVSA